jgi:D-xylose 1-dehydrogenase (NADP+, D-xylono-1,5-lactone-forming)
MTMSMLLRFPHDTIALLDCSFECSSYRNRIEIVGTKGALEFPDGVLPKPDSPLIFRQGEAGESLTFPSNNQYVGQIECFCASVAAGRLLDPAENGLANMQVLDAARQIAGAIHAAG